MSEVDIGVLSLLLEQIPLYENTTSGGIESHDFAVVKL
jgi:hypothetical protein